MDADTMIQDYSLQQTQAIYKATVSSKQPISDKAWKDIAFLFLLCFTTSPFVFLLCFFVF